jgi:hypothetical protein
MKNNYCKWNILLQNRSRLRTLGSGEPDCQDQQYNQPVFRRLQKSSRQKRSRTSSSDIRKYQYFNVDRRIFRVIQLDNPRGSCASTAKPA